VVEPCIHSGPVADCMSCWVGQALRCEAENRALRDDLKHLLDVYIENGMVEAEDEAVIERLWLAVADIGSGRGGGSDV
jgi:hypothetical protein